jgi:2-polyprenyl-6-methoxyphenol hydroxylase-like FAD-dependent oxidoreductase
MSDEAPAQQVLIVGAGPAGLFVAAELARHGMIGFRAVPADARGVAALDAHLASYLVSSNAVTAANASSVSPVVATG